MSELERFLLQQPQLYARDFFLSNGDLIGGRLDTARQMHHLIKPQPVVCEPGVLQHP